MMSALAFLTSAAIAIFTAVVLVLIQTVFWSPSITAAMGIVAIGTAVVAYFRPHNGLLVLAAIAPLGAVWGPLLGDRVRGGEALVLAFLAGALLRGWTLHRFWRLPWDRLQLAALLFGLLVAASCLEQLWLLGATSRSLFDYLIRHYLTSFRGFGAIFSAMLILEGLALLVYTAHYCRIQPDLGWRLARMLVIGAIAAAAINFWFFVHELIETGEPRARLVDFFVRLRWSAHVGDVNAAGSFFALFMFVAFGLALKDRTYRAAWTGAGAMLGLALWMTKSRTAVSAVLVVGALYIVRATIVRSISWWRLVILAVAVSALMVGFASQVARSSAAARSVNYRRMFLETTSHMIEAHPVFGVGIGQYARWSAHFSSPALIAIYPRENAHNNFAQVAGELGLTGLAAFVAVLAVCLWPRDRSRSGHPVVAPVLGGLAVFIVSWFGGHPLLVPEVAYPFWIALAIVPGTTSDIISRPHG